MFFARVHVLVGWLLSRILSGFPHKNLGSRMDPSSEQTTLTLCLDLNEHLDVFVHFSWMQAFDEKNLPFLVHILHSVISNYM